METVAIPVAALWNLVALVLGVVLGWFAGRQYQRRREEGMERPAIIDDTKAKIEAELRARYEAGVSEVQRIAAQIRDLRK